MQTQRSMLINTVVIFIRKSKVNVLSNYRIWDIIDYVGRTDKSVRKYWNSKPMQDPDGIASTRLINEVRKLVLAKDKRKWTYADEE